MSKRTGITAILFLFLFASSAQKKLSFIEADKISYELYQQQKWEELIDFSGEVRDQGIDFFYLQARTAIAWYNLKKYNKSTRFFLKAWESDSSPEWLQEYLYFSLIFSGQSTEASKMASYFSESMKQKISYQERKVLLVAFEAGYSFNPDFDKLTKNSFDEEMNVGNDYGEAFFLKDYHFESVDLSHQIAPGGGMNHNFTYLNISREQQVDWGGRNTLPVKTNQFQYYINPYFVLGKKLNISQSVNIIWGTSSYFSGGYSNSTPVFYKVDYTFSDYIFSFSAWSRFGNFSPGAEVNFANINDKKITQFSGWTTFYPFSNYKFHLTPRLYLRGGDEHHLWYSIFGVSGGAKLGPVNFYGQYLTGSMETFIGDAGYVVSNFPGKLNQKISGSLYFPIGEKYQFVVRYINQNIIEQYNVYSNGVLSNSLEYKYTKHTLTGGLSWSF